MRLLVKIVQELLSHGEKCGLFSWLDSDIECRLIRRAIGAKALKTIKKLLVCELFTVRQNSHIASRTPIQLHCTSQRTYSNGQKKDVSIRPFRRNTYNRS
jgi:hypothetical protein